MHLLVIGGGPGGYVAAIRAAQLGATVTLVEKENLGGTCLNVGCIPTKVLLHAADVYRKINKSASIGIKVDGVEIDWMAVQNRRMAVTKQLVGGVSGLMRANKIKVVEGSAAFLGKDSVEVTKKNGNKNVISFDKAIIASGSVPFVPPIEGVSHDACINSTGALRLKEIPKSMVIIGGGVIGVEIATAYRTFGTEVTIVEMLPKILANMDLELSLILQKRLESDGIVIYTNAKVEKISDANGNAMVSVEYQGKTLSLSAEKVLMAVGRRPETTSLKLENAGVLTKNQSIIVNDKMETSVLNIYAIGDVTGKMMLAHVASTQGEIAAENAMGHNILMDYKTAPGCVYTTPEFASVGMTEEAAHECGIDVQVGRFPLMANGKSLIVGSTDGMVKIITDTKYKEILGVHILGDRATDLIAEGALAIRLEATIDELISTIHAHPTISEAVKEAALAVDKRAIHVPNKKLASFL